MKTNRTIGYALACLKELARQFGEFVQVAEIARLQNLPPAYCQKILLALTRAGIVQSIKGRGFTLLRPMEEIPTLAVVRALSINEETEADSGESFSLRAIHDQLTARLNKALAEVTVAEIVR